MRPIVAVTTLCLALSACGDDSGAPDSASDGGGSDASEQGGDPGPPPGGDAGPADTDAGPEPRCGNGVLNTDEICEGFELREATCESEGFTTGKLRCSDDCQLDTSECTSCGDGDITADEVCEPDDLAGATCASELGAGFTGVVECAPDCTSLDTSACRQEIPAQAFRSCDPDVASPCTDSAAECVETSSGNFCFETCDRMDRGSCGVAERFCHDFDGQGVCVDVPTAGEVCTTVSGCLDATTRCLPTFDPASGPEVSICGVACTADQIGTGMGCPAGEYCNAVPGGQMEAQSQTVCGSDQDCNTAAGYRCKPSGDPDTDPSLCLRPVSMCSPIVAFYPFDGSSTLGSICDLAYPSQGAQLCGIGANSAGFLGPLAIPVCHGGLRAETDALGVCIGFCDSAIIAAGEDGFCGDDFTCAAPTQPEFYVAATEAAPMTCDPANSRCTGEFPDCVDVGRGFECARPARMCIPM